MSTKTIWVLLFSALWWVNQLRTKGDRDFVLRHLDLVLTGYVMCLLTFSLFLVALTRALNEH